MDTEFCTAFCDGIKVTKVPCGFAVSTAFENPEGDRIGFYAVKVGDKYRIEDEGSIFPILDAALNDATKGTRGEAFAKLQEEYGVSLDKDTYEFKTDLISEGEVPHVALKFTAFLLRVWDLLLLQQHTVASTFKDDARKAVEEHFANVKIEHDTMLDEQHQFYVPDTILRPQNGAPIAIYYGTSASKVDEAVILRLDTNLHHESLKVVLLQETAKTSGIPERSLARAYNSLDAMPVFRGNTLGAMQKIESLLVVH